MAAKNKVEVRIGGKDYTLVGVESDEYIQKVALYIDKKMLEIMRQNSKLSTSMAAVLTAINVADDYFKTFESENRLKTEVKKTSDELDRLREEMKRLLQENAALAGRITSLQLELAKREAELGEVRNTVEKTARYRVDSK